MRKQVSNAKARGLQESVLLARDRQNHPPPTHDCRGIPPWEGSDAERLLKQDMDDGLHDTMPSIQLHSTRHEYGAFPPTVFRKHIDQERQYRKFVAQLNAKRNR
jgi:hypothetical protein